VRYTLPRRASVSLDVYDVSGRYVRTLQSGPLDAGPHESFWDGSGRGGARVAPGVYFARLALADGGAINSRIVVVE
jgi:flagellar hook assembly protein FlgD